MGPYPPPGRLTRKWRKLRRDPVRFFADAKSPVVRTAGIWGLAALGREMPAEELLEPLTRYRMPPAEPAAPRPSAPPEEAWAVLAEERRKTVAAEPALDVVVPVYRGYEDTLACLWSVLNAQGETPFELIAIDDSSPDPALSAMLRRLAGLGLFTLHGNERNLGFVRTANRGMALHPHRDLVLLNADTVVHGDWLDRLRRHAGANPCAATVTPLSNNATICSYPVFVADNRAALELDGAELDRLCADANPGLSVEAPTGVGFCMYIRREALAAIGPFDAERFGRGYGEENDFCRRAIAHGWTNLIAGDVFVRHTGEVSFAGSAAAHRRAGIRAVAERHPDYLPAIERFIAADLVAPLRRRIDLARLRRMAGAGAVLAISHGRGGGVERHIRDEAAALEAGGGPATLVLRSMAERPGLVTLGLAGGAPLPNLFPLDLADGASGRGDLAEILGALPIRRIHVHSLADYPPGAPALIAELAAGLGLDYDFMLHDYLPVCPRINLIDRSGVYCGETGPAACAKCLARGDVPPGADDIEAWRAGYGRLLAGARRVAAPSGDAARRLGRYFPDLAVETAQHREVIAAPEGFAPPPDRHPGEPLRIAVIGAIGPHKGSAVLRACARDAARRKLPLEFTVIGTADNAATLAALPNVTVTGRYGEDEVWALIAASRCHMAFLPAVWPETYSYTLSIALAAGLPVAVFDLGAPAERLRAAADAGGLLPLDLAAAPARLNDALMAAGGGAP